MQVPGSSTISGRRPVALVPKNAPSSNCRGSLEDQPIGRAAVQEHVSRRERLLVDIVTNERTVRLKERAGGVRRSGTLHRSVEWVIGPAERVGHSIVI